MANNPTYPTQQTDWIAQVQSQSLVGIITESVVIPARTAADGTETIVFRAPSNCQTVTIFKVSIIPSVAITGAATNFQTLSTRKIHGVTPAAITGATTFVTTASLAVFTANNLYSNYTTTALTISASDSITLKNTATASGAALPEMVVVVEYTVTTAPL